MNSNQSTQGDRLWPLPSRAWVMRMTWSELLFAHWSFEPEVVAARLPQGLDVDTYDGKAWVGVVPFLMSGVAPRACPSLPWFSRFLELNVRTYVIKDGKPGVWFWSLDAENPVAVRVARRTFCLPYMDASMSMHVSEETQLTRYQSRRTHRGEHSAELDIDYVGRGAAFLAKPGTLEYWLTARYCLYSADTKGVIYRGEIDHEPWTLMPADCTIRVNTMGDQCGLDFSAQPHTLCAAPVKVRAWWPSASHGT